jgi:hypothetical protein
MMSGCVAKNLRAPIVHPTCIPGLDFARRNVSMQRRQANGATNLATIRRFPFRLVKQDPLHKPEDQQ